MARRREVHMLPEALKAWREVRGVEERGKKWSLDDLADRIPGGTVSASQLGMIESGKRQPSRLNADDIAKALDVPLEAIAIVFPDPMLDAADAIAEGRPHEVPPVEGAVA